MTDPHSHIHVWQVPNDDILHSTVLKLKVILKAIICVDKTFPAMSCQPRSTTTGGSWTSGLLH